MNNWVFLLLWVHFAYCAKSSDWRAIFFCFVLKDILKGHLSDCTWIKFKICESYLGHAVMFPLFYIPSRTTLCALNRNSDRSEPPALLERDTPRGVQSGQFSFKRNMLHTEQSHLWGKVFHCGELVFFFLPVLVSSFVGQFPLDVISWGLKTPTYYHLSLQCVTSALPKRDVCRSVVWRAGQSGGQEPMLSC